MKSDLIFDKEYKAWLAELKEKVQQAQLKAAVKVNSEMLLFYWELGADIVAKQAKAKWGEKFLAQLSQDLTAEFPDMKGFSERNLKYIRQWYLFYSKGSLIGQQAVAQLGESSSIGQQPVGQITQIPWGHNIAILSKCKKLEEALFYIENTLKFNWSRDVLIHQIESGLYRREGKSLTNFSTTLPKPQSDLARQTLKNPYVFDFLTLREEHDEKELENELVSQVTRFLLELGAGFSYVGRQYKLEVKGDEFFIDLLFYHTRLHCYIVIELKSGKFKPEFAGKLNFYVSAVDAQLKGKQDETTIGILICKSKNDTVVEYTLKDIGKPIGVSAYKITKHLPKEYRSSLPSIKEIEAELEK